MFALAKWRKLKDYERKTCKLFLVPSNYASRRMKGKIDTKLTFGRIKQIQSYIAYLYEI